MGASNFARPENASKYFVVLTNTEEKFVKCEECGSKYYVYDDQYEETKECGYCLDCLSEDLEWGEEYRSPDEWEIDDLKNNIRESLREKFPDIRDTDYRDNDRNYPSSGIAEIRKLLYFAGLNIDISITIIMTSAYYEGATLDYLIKFDIDDYTEYQFNQVDFLEVNDLTQTLSEGMAKIQLPNVINKIKKEVGLITAGIEEVFIKYSDQYARLGGLSDGTSVYVKA